MTIRKYTFLRRRAGLSPEGFRDAWRGRYVGGAAADLAPVASAFVHNEVLPQVPDLMPEPIWDGVEETVMKADAVSLEAIRDNPLHRFGPGLADFVDPDQIVQFFAEDKVVIDGPARGICILSLPRRRPGLSPAEFSRHYRNVHGELVTQVGAFTTNCNRYVQHHILPHTVKATEGFLPYEGISEFWFDSLDHAKAAWGAPEYMEKLRADEKNFVGSPPSHRVLVVPAPVALG